MPKLWTETIATHRDHVQGAILNATAALVAEHGLRGATMSRIAERSGIGRATLYKYFPDVESILTAWHQRQVNDHLERLSELAEQSTGPLEGLTAVLSAYADIRFGANRRDHGAELVTALHRGADHAGAERRLQAFVSELITQAAAAGAVRSDAAADELADYCLSALEAAARQSSPTAVRRLVSVTISGLSPQ